jgi:hypothetical protein
MLIIDDHQFLESPENQNKGIAMTESDSMLLYFFL